MLKHRLIPTVILDQGNVVQSKNFVHTNIIGNAITAIDFFNSWASDEIIILDVSINKEKREEFLGGGCCHAHVSDGDARRRRRRQ